MNELRDIHGFCDSVKLGWVRLEMADSAGVADFPVSQAGFFGIPGGEGGGAAAGVRDQQGSRNREIKTCSGEVAQFDDLLRTDCLEFQSKFGSG